MINQPDTISSALTAKFGGSEAKQVMEKIGAPEVKKALSTNTEKAMDDGAFGLPWFVATNANGETEEFWGVDHMAQVVEHLGLDRKQEPGLRAML